MGIPRLMLMAILGLAVSVTAPSTAKSRPSSATRHSNAGERAKPSRVEHATTAKHTTAARSSDTPNSTDAPRPVVPVPGPDDVAMAQGTATFSISWQSINSGGAPAASANYSVNGSVGQAAIGFTSSTSYQAGVGYWYGASPSACTCPFQADFNVDGFIDAVDLGAEIDAIFFGGFDPQDPGCPAHRGDFNGDGFTDAVDLGGLIDHIFFGGSSPADPCVP